MNPINHDKLRKLRKACAPNQVVCHRHDGRGWSLFLIKPGEHIIHDTLYAERDTELLCELLDRAFTTWAPKRDTATKGYDPDIGKRDLRADNEVYFDMARKRGLSLTFEPSLAGGWHLFVHNRDGGLVFHANEKKTARCIAMLINAIDDGRV